MLLEAWFDCLFIDQVFGSWTIVYFSDLTYPVESDTPVGLKTEILFLEKKQRILRVFEPSSIHRIIIKVDNIIQSVHMLNTYIVESVLYEAINIQ